MSAYELRVSVAVFNRENGDRFQMEESIQLPDSMNAAKALQAVGAAYEAVDAIRKEYEGNKE